MITFASICPHPPLLIPEIGGDNIEKVRKPISSLLILNNRLREINPETIVVISPHGMIYSHKMALIKAEYLQGSFEYFKCALSLEFEGDMDAAERIRRACEKKHLPLEVIDYKEKDSSSAEDLDHGVLVPLYYLSAGLKKTKILPIYYSYLGRESHVKFGEIINTVLNDELKNKRVAIVASGDLSHRLTMDAPGGYTPLAKTFDEQFVTYLKKGRVTKIIDMDHEIVEEAGECGFRSALILFGALKNLKYNVNVLSYEAPFGVGYLVCDFIV